MCILWYKAVYDVIIIYLICSVIITCTNITSARLIVYSIIKVVHATECTSTTESKIIRSFNKRAGVFLWKTNKTRNEARHNRRHCSTLIGQFIASWARCLPPCTVYCRYFTKSFPFETTFRVNHWSENVDCKLASICLSKNSFSTFIEMIHLRYYDDYDDPFLHNASDDDQFNIATSVIVVIVVAVVTIIIVFIITTIIIINISNRTLGSMQIKYWLSYNGFDFFLRQPDKYVLFSVYFIYRSNLEINIF